MLALAQTTLPPAVGMHAHTRCRSGGHAPARVSMRAASVRCSWSARLGDAADARLRYAWLIDVYRTRVDDDGEAGHARGADGHGVEEGEFCCVREAVHSTTGVFRKMFSSSYKFLSERASLIFSSFKFRNSDISLLLKKFSMF